jgi:hypothetical protein
MPKINSSSVKICESSQKVLKKFSKSSQKVLKKFSKSSQKVLAQKFSIVTRAVVMFDRAQLVCDPPLVDF